jgi:hypothetical protein
VQAAVAGDAFAFELDHAAAGQSLVAIRAQIRQQVGDLIGHERCRFGRGYLTRCRAGTSILGPAALHHHEPDHHHADQQCRRRDRSTSPRRKGRVRVRFATGRRAQSRFAPRRLGRLVYRELGLGLAQLFLRCRELRLERVEPLLLLHILRTLARELFFERLEPRQRRLVVIPKHAPSVPRGWR